ncbi:type II toxin-antitoxin system RelE/ParE family toxin [Dietzia massiliensis]|uniref:type II toxin-antitoxin system RelE/ParE family toxin n=1 Tax=Dietzia massiliensis TaxID=2697499 RepID=UPI001BCA72F2|nr:hypothetical protein [Dietzia massiliensis]MBS7548309.1 hypothetical protein [Dietzia massiliensis]
MDVEYATKKLERTCNSSRLLKKEFGAPAGKAVEKRIVQLRTADCMDDLKYVTGKWHEMSGDLKGEWAAHLTPNWRIVVVPVGNDAVQVVRIEDYH